MVQILVMKDNITATQSMISSCTGAIVTSLFVTPLDVVKIRLQAQQKELMKKKCLVYSSDLMEHLCCYDNVNGIQQQHLHKLSSHWYKRPHFTGTFDAFIKIARYEGVSSLWSGLPPTLVMAVPATVIYFTVYDQFRNRMNMWLQARKQSVWVPVTAGAVARVFAATLVSPLELVRTKMQSRKLKYSEIGYAIKSLVQARGITALYTGLGPTLLRDVPFSCIYWATYESLKQHFNQERPTFWFSFTAGATAGSVAAISTLPFDVIKTHKQIELGEMEMYQKKRSESTFSLMRKLYRTQGLTSLFAGIVPRLIKVAPACAFMISMYECGKNFFRQYNAKFSSDIPAGFSVAVVDLKKAA